MNLITRICHRLRALPMGPHVRVPEAFAPLSPSAPQGRRLCAFWLPAAANAPLRLHWRYADNQKPPSRWRTGLSLA